MALVIGVPKETAPARSASRPCPRSSRSSSSSASRSPWKAAPATRRTSATTPTAPPAPRSSRDAAALWAKSDIVFKVRAPSPRKSACMREGSTLICFIWPAQNPELMQQLAAQKATVLAIDSCRACSRAQKTRCAVLDGQHRRLPRRDRGGARTSAASSPARSPPPARCRRPRCSSSAPASPAWRRSAPRPAWAPSCAPTTRAPKSADQVKSLGGEFVKVDYEEEGSGGGGYAKVMSEGFQKAQREMFAKQAREVDIIITTALIPGKPAPQADHRRDGAVDEAGQRDRRPGGRAGRQLRADRAGQGRGQARRDHHRLHRPAEPSGEAVVHALRDQPAAA